jgi:hypothetical protein
VVRANAACEPVARLGRDIGDKKQEGETDDPQCACFTRLRHPRQLPDNHEQGNDLDQHSSGEDDDTANNIPAERRVLKREPAIDKTQFPRGSRILDVLSDAHRCRVTNKRPFSLRRRPGFERSTGQAVQRGA